LKASDSLPGSDDHASSGAVRFFNSLELLGRGTDTTGTLYCLVEYRHSLDGNVPNEFSLGQLGNAGFITIGHEVDQWHLTHLYWHQSWNSGDIEAVAGFLDITDFVDTWALTSPWTDFYNYVFSIGAGTIDLPNDAALGVAAGAYLTDNFYLLGGFEDMNSDPSDPGDGFDTFWNDHEFFKHIELGWTSSKEMYFHDNVHLTYWNSDERKDLGIEDGWGMVLSMTHTVGDHWLPFLRGGYADDGGSLLRKSLSAGAGYQPNTDTDMPGDQLGFGVNWGEPNDALFGSGLDDQYAVELYYRWQVTKELSISPDIQLLFDPAFNPDEERIWVYGLRARLVF
jgi:porin